MRLGIEQRYAELISQVLTHREFVLLDGKQCSPSDVFDEKYCTGQDAAAPLGTDGSKCSRCGGERGFSEGDPVNFFLSCHPGCRGADLARQSLPTEFNPGLALLPQFLPRRFEGLRQTPAFVRLLTLALLDSMAEWVEEQQGGGSSGQEALFCEFLRKSLSSVFFCLVKDVVRPPLVSPHPHGCLGTTEVIEKPSKPLGLLDASRSRSGTPGSHLAMPNSSHHRTQLRGWQAISCLSHHLSIFSPEVVETLSEGVWEVLGSAQMADVRHYVELVAVRTALHLPSKCIPRLVALLNAFNTSRQVLISALIVSGYLLLHIDHSVVDTNLLHGIQRTLFEAIVPFLTSNAAYCRAIAQFVVHSYLRQNIGILQKFHVHGNGDASILELLFRMLDTAKEACMMREKVAATFSRWNPSMDGGILGLLPESGLVEETDEQHGEQALMLASYNIQHG